MDINYNVAAPYETIVLEETHEHVIKHDEWGVTKKKIEYQVSKQGDR